MDGPMRSILLRDDNPKSPLVVSEYLRLAGVYCERSSRTPSDVAKSFFVR
jgi:hypothetical protein